MDMDTGRRKGIRHDINVTPLIDVVLVLLIIFMVLTPMLQMAHGVDVPEAAAKARQAAPAVLPLVLAVERDGSMSLNTQPLAREEVAEKLAAAFATRSEKDVFVKADASLRYQDVVGVLDLVKHGGADRIAVVTPASDPANASPATRN
ncbi:MAG: biopolymer transporter ExbD [Acidobacteriota bacterium]